MLRSLIARDDARCFLIKLLQRTQSSLSVLDMHMCFVNQASLFLPDNLAFLVDAR